MWQIALLAPLAALAVGCRAPSQVRDRPEQAAVNPVCGDGIVSPGEPCDVASLEERCPEKYGCITTKARRCECAISCDIVEPSDEASDTADAIAEAQVPNAYGSAEKWERYWRIMETELGCSVHTEGSRGSGPQE